MRPSVVIQSCLCVGLCFAARRGKADAFISIALVFTLGKLKKTRKTKVGNGGILKSGSGNGAYRDCKYLFPGPRGDTSFPLVE